MGVKDDGTLWAWGSHGHGQTGLADGDIRSYPVQLGTETDWSAIDGGAAHSLGLDNDGILWAWGYNGTGQLGLGDTTEQASPVRIPEPAIQ